MEDEDDYDLDDELEQALAEDGHDEEGQQGAKAKKTSFLAGPGLPGLPEKASESETQAAPSGLALIDQLLGSPETEKPEEDEAEPPSELTQPQQPELEDEARQKQALLEMLNEDQLNRYEAYRRSALNRKGMKRLLQAVTGQNPNAASSANVVIIMCGVAKMFVGELIEEARAIAAEQGNFGPLQPSHIHAAYQQLHARGKTSHSGLRKCL